jgi:hypothetical protein
LEKFVAGRYSIADIFWMRSGIKVAIRKLKCKIDLGDFNDAFGFCGVIFWVMV